MEPDPGGNTNSALFFQRNPERQTANSKELYTLFVVSEMVVIPQALFSFYHVTSGVESCILRESEKGRWAVYESNKTGEVLRFEHT